MTIEICEPELEALIQQRMASGRFKTLEAALWDAFEISADQGAPGGALSTRTEYEPIAPDKAGMGKEFQEQDCRANLADFLLDSPLHGSGLVVERIHDRPRETDL